MDSNNVGPNANGLSGSAKFSLNILLVYQMTLCPTCLFQRRICALLPQVLETVIKRNLTTTQNVLAKKNKLVVGGLPKDMDKNLLVEYYSKIGEVKRIDLKPSSDEPNKLGTQNAHIFFNSQTRLKMAMKAPLPECARFDQDKRLPEDIRKESTIFVGGLKSDTTEEMLYAFYAQFGTPLRVHLEKNDKGMSMKFAYVTYESKNEVESALSSTPHIIDGKEVTVRERRPLDRTVFVGLLAENTSEESLTSYFSKFGTVKYCIFKRSEWTGLPLRAAYVTFAEPGQMSTALSSAPHNIDGKTVPVAKTEAGSDLHRASENTLRLRWMSPHTTVDSLERFYSQFGQLLDCSVAEDPELRRGLHGVYGTVTFLSSDGVSKALKSLPHEIDNVEVVVEPFRIGGPGSVEPVREEPSRSREDVSGCRAQTLDNPTRRPHFRYANRASYRTRHSSRADGHERSVL
ncbi:RNA recognition motif domain-containing protein [Ditylenchus destructor]|nr:RNA recognition motif domain-containing protein [Ditylenchus destructor]